MHRLIVKNTEWNAADFDVAKTDVERPGGTLRDGVGPCFMPLMRCLRRRQYCDRLFTI